MLLLTGFWLNDIGSAINCSGVIVLKISIFYGDFLAINIVLRLNKCAFTTLPLETN